MRAQAGLSWGRTGTGPSTLGLIDAEREPDRDAVGVTDRAGAAAFPPVLHAIRVTATTAMKPERRALAIGRGGWIESSEVDTGPFFGVADTDESSTRPGEGLSEARPSN